MIQLATLRKGCIVKPKGNGSEHCIISKIEWSDAIGQCIVQLENINDRTRTTSCPEDMIRMLYYVVDTEIGRVLYAAD